MALEHRPMLLSYEDVLKLPPESPGEVIDGELIVTPAPHPKHQRIVVLIVQAIQSYLDVHAGVGVVYVAPLDVVLRTERPAIVLQPDVLFVAAARESIVTDAVHGAPDLVVEVVSPSTKRTDAVKKRELYGAHGVNEYWLVWPDERQVDVFTPRDQGGYGGPKELTVGDMLTTALLPDFALEVARVFA